MPAQSKSTTRLEVSPLESRDLMSVASVVLASGCVSVTADNAASVVTELTWARVRVRETDTGRTWSYPRWR